MSDVAMSGELHARIDELLGHVERDVDEHHQDRDVEHDALQQDQVLPLDRLHGGKPEAGPGEHGLDHDRVAGERADHLPAGERHHRHRDVAQRVHADHTPERQTLRNRDLDVLGVELVHHRGADHHHHAGERRQRQCDGGQHHVLEIAAARGRQPSEIDREHDDEEKTQPELRHRQPEQAKHHGHAVEDAAGLERSEDAERDRQSDRKRHAHHDEIERHRQLLEHDLRDRPMLPQALAEIQPRDIAEKIEELDVERAIKPELLGEGRALGSGALHRQHRRHGIADHAGDQEHHDGDAQHHVKAVVEALDDEGPHRVVLPVDRPPPDPRSNACRHSGARAKRGSPESIITSRGYGFRARRSAAPRNDAQT